MISHRSHELLVNILWIHVQPCCWSACHTLCVCVCLQYQLLHTLPNIRHLIHHLSVEHQWVTAALRLLIFLSAEEHFSSWQLVMASSFVPQMRPDPHAHTHLSASQRDKIHPLLQSIVLNRVPLSLEGGVSGCRKPTQTALRHFTIRTLGSTWSLLHCFDLSNISSELLSSV